MSVIESHAVIFKFIFSFFSNGPSLSFAQYAGSVSRFALCCPQCRPSCCLSRRYLRRWYYMPGFPYVSWSRKFGTRLTYSKDGAIVVHSTAGKTPPFPRVKHNLTLNRCGSTVAYCGTGCQSAFGSCNPRPSNKASSSSAKASSTTLRTSVSTASRTPSRTSSASPSSSQLVSTNARCGPLFGGKTCLGTKWGNCCSQ
jgi:hypothetical protein